MPDEQPTDAELMAALGHGRLDALATLFERHHGKVYGMLRRVTGSVAVGEDLTQEVFLRVLRYRASFRGEGRFRAWLYRITHNVLTDHRASAARQVAGATDPDGHAGSLPSPLRSVEERQERERLYAALVRLTPEQREVLVLSRFEDLTYEEIAGLQECSVDAVKARAYRALRRLAALLDEAPQESVR